MDEMQYEDDINGNPYQQDAPISSALVEQRQQKKKAQEDVKLLANRIALLKLEEKKVSKISA